jgi:hypothetical protein
MVVIETKSQIMEMGGHEIAASQSSGGSYPTNGK